ncbi:MAG: hypothetical protein DLM55_04920 [Acidimicrobiales bacterium]|nr:MAG: hypothetical protein DLM55_04920 [Acidimicrobiales bacterium]
MDTFIEVEYEAVGHALTHEDGERLMDALLDLELLNEDMLDCGTATNTANSILTATLTIRATDESEAIKRALPIVRAAIHSIGRATPEWPSADDIDTLFQRRETRFVAA